MKLFDSKIKKFLTFLEMEPCTFSAQAQKKKKKSTQRDVFKLQETKTLEKYLIFSEKKESFSYIS